MSEDDPTKDLPSEDAPTAEPIGILPHGSDTRPMLDRLLEEMISTRNTLMAEIHETRETLLSRIGGIEQQLELVNNKLDVLGRHSLSTEADVVALGKRLEKLEDNKPQ